jgi:glucose-6-phosphate 1-epimerase
VTETGWTQGIRNGLEVLELATPASTCTVALHGAQVLAFAPRDGRDWLWVSDKALFQVGKALRGGVPVCFPWFGPHPGGGDLPAHGFARTRLWRLSRVDALDARRVRAELELGSDAATMRLFPHAFTARLAVTAGEELELAFEVVNTGDAPFAFEVALHTYFAVSAAASVAVGGLSGCDYADKAAGGERRRQGDEPIRFDGEVDRVYDGGGPATLADPSRARPIQIESTGAGSTIVWNPGPIKTRTLADMRPDGFHGFVCVETGNVGDRKVTLSPGARHETRVRYAEVGKVGAVG